MQLIYTNENAFLVINAKNIVENARIEVMLKNEFLGAGAGDLAPLNTWVELWVMDDADYSLALKALELLSESTDQANWLCPKCNEENPASFEICWNCQGDKPER